MAELDMPRATTNSRSPAQHRQVRGIFPLANLRMASTKLVWVMSGAGQVARRIISATGLRSSRCAADDRSTVTRGRCHDESVGQTRRLFHDDTGPRTAIRDVAPPALAEPGPTATSAWSDPVAPAQAPTDVVRAPGGTVKILFFSANTKSSDQLALDEEYRAIEQRIRLARHRDAFQPIFKPAARRADLQDALLEHSPHVVHFACHGSSQAEIVLRSEGPASDPVAADSLAALFSVLHDNVVLVVFNACFASAQASAIRRSAKVAIGMRSRIEDEAAITFASALYGALAYGRSVQDAFTLGVAALDARQCQHPELFVRPGVDASKVYLVKPRRSRARLMALVAVVACAALAVGGRRLWSAPDSGIRHPPPVRGMVRFAATDIRPGGFDTTGQPTSCPVAEEATDSAEPVHPERVASTHVAAFELDVMEVTNGELADWLNANSLLWTTDRWGGILLQRGGVRLALASEDCFGALAITPGNRVVVSPDKARWPAVCVTWQGATEYCRGQHKRLPLMVEWELAARGTGGRVFPWGIALPKQGRRRV